MKKALLIILSLILMLSGVWSALILSAVAVAPDFEDTSKWVIYTDLSTHVNSEKGKVSSWGKTTLNTNPSYIAEGDKSVKFYSQWQKASFAFNTQKNTEYTLSFKYYFEGDAAPLGMVGVVNPNLAAHARYTGGADGETYYSYIDTNGAYTTPDGIFSHRTEDWSTKTKANYQKNAWNDVVINFNSGDNENLSLVIIFEFANVYVDAFNLLSDEPEPEPEPVIETEFENASRWAIYKDVSKYVNPEQGTLSSWGKATENTDKAYVISGEKSVKLYSQWQKASFAFNTQKNTEYTLSFKYYFEGDAAPLGMVGVVNPNMAAHARYTGDADGETYYSYIDTYGAYTTPDGIFSHRTEDWNTKTKDTYIKNAWNSVNLKFSSGDNEKLALVVIFEYANVYVDDFSLTSKTSSNTSSTTTSSVTSTTSSATTTSSVTSTTTSTTSSTTSTTTSSTPEPTPVFDSYFETPSSWAIYTNLSTHVNSEKGTLSSWGKAVANTDKAFVAEGNGSVILNAQWQKSSVEFEVEKGKNYAFSFKYYSTNATAPLSSIGVLNSDLAAEGRNAANETYYSFIDKYGSFTTTDGIYSNRTENWDIKTGTNYVANDWNDISIIFNSGENTSLTLVVIFEVAGIYMDSFSLSEYTPPPVPETEASYWQVYLNSTDIVDGNGSNRANKSWNKVTDNKTDVQYGDMASVMGYGSHITIIRLLGELEVNQDYKISFAYYSDETNVTYSDSLFSQQGILTKGTELGQGGGAYPKSVYYAADPCAGEQGKWHKYEFSFTNWDNTEKYFYCVPVFEGGAKKFYVADFKIEKTTLEKKTPRPFTGWGDEPKEEYLINFDDFLVPFTESVVEISEGPARDGKTSNTMHILPIESQTSIFPRYQSIKNYTDSIFTLNVKPNTLYEYSFWIFIHEKAEIIKADKTFEVANRLSDTIPPYGVVVYTNIED